MAIDYQYYKEQGYILSYPQGKVTLDDIKMYSEKLFRDESITGPFLEVVNFKQVDEFAFGYYEAGELLALFEKLISSKGYKGACLVVERDVEKSIANIIREAAKELNIIIRTFRTIEDACKYAELSAFD